MGGENPTGVSCVRSPAIVAVVKSVDGQCSSLKHILKLDQFPFVLKGLFFFFLLFAPNFIYGNQIKMVSAYIYYNVDTDLVVLKCLPFMVVTSYY